VSFLHCARDVAVEDLARHPATGSEVEAGDRSYVSKARGRYMRFTSYELLTKQEMRKNFLYTKNICILKLILNVVTAGIEALVSGNKFLYACVKEICRL
jgi:hypothetical protein